MQAGALLRRRWQVLALVFLGLVGVLAVAQAAENPIFQFANDKEDVDETGWLGVYIQDIDDDLAESEGLPSTDGVMVNGIVDNSPAEEAGLKEGDVILKFDGQDVNSVRRLTRVIEEATPKSKINVSVLRDGKTLTIPVEIGSQEDDSAVVWNWDGFDTGDLRMFTPRPGDARAPRAYSFSLGQLSSSYIGVGLYDMSEQLAGALGAADGGALINDVEKDSPAEKAGLKAGDVIVEIDHKKVYDTDDVRKAIHRKKDGETVTVRVLRDKTTDKTVDVTVESNDTWSGIEPPQRFHVRPDNARLFDLPTLPRGRMRDAMRENRDDLQEQLRELREELEELRKELRDLR